MVAAKAAFSAWCGVEAEVRRAAFGRRSIGVDDLEGDWACFRDTLTQWGHHPSQIDENELESPSLMAIDLAYEVLRFIKDDLHFLPSRIVSDGEGGIEVEKDSPGAGVLRFEISSEGALQLLQFDETKLTFREQLPT